MLTAAWHHSEVFSTTFGLFLSVDRKDQTRSYPQRVVIMASTVPSFQGSNGSKEKYLSDTSCFLSSSLTGGFIFGAAVFVCASRVLMRSTQHGDSTKKKFAVRRER